MNQKDRNYKDIIPGSRPSMRSYSLTCYRTERKAFSWLLVVNRRCLNLCILGTPPQGEQEEEEEEDGEEEEEEEEDGEEEKEDGGKEEEEEEEQREEKMGSYLKTR